MTWKVETYSLCAVKYKYRDFDTKAAVMSPTDPNLKKQIGHNCSVRASDPFTEPNPKHPLSHATLLFKALNFTSVYVPVSRLCLFVS